MTAPGPIAVRAVPPPDARCVGYDVKSGRPCHRDADDEVTAGCVHEHIGTRALCQFHIADLAHDRMHCGDCKDCTDPHVCTLVAIPTRHMTTTREPETTR